MHAAENFYSFGTADLRSANSSQRNIQITDVADKTDQVGRTFASLRLAPARDRIKPCDEERARLQARMFVYRC